MTTKLIHSKDLRLRIKYEKKQHNKIINCILRSDKFLPKGIIHTQYDLTTKSKNRCLRSGRCRAVLNKYALSRMTFKHYARNCLINGVKKTSW